MDRSVAKWAGGELSRFTSLGVGTAAVTTDSLLFAGCWREGREGQGGTRETRPRVELVPRKSTRERGGGRAGERARQVLTTYLSFAQAIASAAAEGARARW